MNFFQVDVSKCGQGKFSSQLTNANTRHVYSIDKLVETGFMSNQPGLFSFSFTPTETAVYRCNLYFNEKHIKGKCLINILFNFEKEFD